MKPTVFRSLWVAPIMRQVSRLIFFLSGWKIQGEFPPERKFLIVGAPHTSNWDAFYFIAAGFLLRREFRWLVKDSVVSSVFGPLALWSGAMPIKRNQQGHQVNDIIDDINKLDEVILIISPEGTRSKTKKWKSGFYHIAKGANLPVVPCYINYAQKIVGIEKPVHLSGDKETDFRKFDELYQAEWAKFPDQFTGPFGEPSNPPTKQR